MANPIHASRWVKQELPIGGQRDHGLMVLLARFRTRPPREDPRANGLTTGHGEPEASSRRCAARPWASMINRDGASAGPGPDDRLAGLSSRLLVVCRVRPRIRLRSMMLPGLVRQALILGPEQRPLLDEQGRLIRLGRDVEELALDLAP